MDILSKLPSVDLQNASSTSMALYTAFLLIKEVTLQQKKCNDGPNLIECTRLIMFPNILKQMAWQNSEMAF